MADDGVCINTLELLKVGQNGDINSSAGCCMGEELRFQNLKDLSVAQLLGEWSGLK